MKNLVAQPNFAAQYPSALEFRISLGFALHVWTDRSADELMISLSKTAKTTV